MIRSMDVYQGTHVTTLLPRLSTKPKPNQFVLWDWKTVYYNPSRPPDYNNYVGRVRDMGFTQGGEVMHAIPCVFRLGEVDSLQSGHYTYLSKEWQFFAFNLLSLSYYGKTYDLLSRTQYNWLAGRFRGLYDDQTAFSNGQGTRTKRNYITGENMDAEKGFGLYTLLCGGASIQTIGEVETNAKGKKVQQVLTFDGTKPPPDISTIDWRRDPRIFYATIISDSRVPWGYKVYKFAYLEDPQTGEVKDCPVPLISSKPVYYALEDLQPIADGLKPSPYWPPVI